MQTDFGRLLKEYRKASHLTQPQVVKKLQDQGYGGHYSKSDISKWEGSKTKPPADVIEALEDIWGITGLLLRAAGYYAEAELRQKDPIKVHARWEHFKDLANTAQLLVSEVESVEPNPKEEEKAVGFEYWIWWTNGLGHSFKREYLVSMLCENEELAVQDNSTRDFYGYLMSHLQTYLPELKEKTFPNVAAEKPYELVQMLLKLSKTRIFKGTCSYCNGL